MICSQRKRQLIKANLNTNQILKFSDKDVELVIITTFNKGTKSGERGTLIH